MNIRKSILVAAFALAALSGIAKEATMTVETGMNRERLHPCTPISLNLISPIGLPWDDWDVHGFQIGLYNQVDNFEGFQVGIVNVTCNFTGFQLGLINVTDRLYGFQVGVVNVINESDLPFLPLINWYF